MITRSLVGLYGKDDPALMLSIMTREEGERVVPGCTSERFYLVDAPSCRCCGEWAAPDQRCHRHRGRNPCAIEGCKRTTEAPRDQLSTEDWLCGQHWKIGCPPHSAERRTYHRFWRIAKRQGWDEPLSRRFWRYWRGLVARARRRCAGDLDMAEVNRLFGWE